VIEAMNHLIAHIADATVSGVIASLRVGIPIVGGRITAKCRGRRSITHRWIVAGTLATGGFYGIIE
jgi:hypothetical protein